MASHYHSRPRKADRTDSKPNAAAPQLYRGGEAVAVAKEQCVLIADSKDASVEGAKLTPAILQLEVGSCLSVLSRKL